MSETPLPCGSVGGWREPFGVRECSCYCGTGEINSPCEKTRILMAVVQIGVRCTVGEACFVVGLAMGRLSDQSLQSPMHSAVVANNNVATCRDVVTHASLDRHCMRCVARLFIVAWCFVHLSLITVLFCVSCMLSTTVWRMCDYAFAQQLFTLRASRLGQSADKASGDRWLMYCGASLWVTDNFKATWLHLGACCAMLGPS